jgi:preprotein translocase subunit SecE
VGDFFQELLSANVYKRSQGRITRQVTFGALMLGFAIGFFRLHQFFDGKFGSVKAFGVTYWLPIILFAIGTWISFRIVNYPSFTDFLIAVEAEMNKVSWPTRSELVRSSLVVLICIVLLAALLFSFDVLWRTIFSFLGIL